MSDGSAQGGPSVIAGRSSGASKRNDLYTEGFWEGASGGGARLSSRAWSHLLAIANRTCPGVPSGLGSCSDYILLCSKLPQNLLA